MIPSTGNRNYMESAQITMELTRNEKYKAQNELNDDVLTVVGRLGTKMKDQAMGNLVKFVYIEIKQIKIHYMQ